MATIPTVNPANLSDSIPAFPGSAQLITPHDTDEFETPVTVYVGGAGSVNVRPASNPSDTVLFTGLAAGTVLPCRVLGVLSTSTTATGLVAVY